MRHFTQCGLHIWQNLENICVVVCVFCHAHKVSPTWVSIKGNLVPQGFIIRIYVGFKKKIISIDI